MGCSGSIGQSRPETPTAVAAEPELVEEPAVSQDNAAAEAGDDELQQELRDLDDVFHKCWVAKKSDTDNATAGSAGSVLKLANLDVGRAKLAEYVFSPKWEVSSKALAYLVRVVEGSPVGDNTIAHNLWELLTQFKTACPPSAWINFPVAMSLQKAKLLFLLLEAFRAEQLIGNLPAIPDSEKLDLQSYAEEIQTLNVRASEGSSTLNLVDESNDIIFELWLDGLKQSVARLKTTTSKGVESLLMAADAVGAAIKLYNGDVTAGLSQLRDTFKHSALSESPWFDDLVLLRKLATDSCQDENLFRRLMWTISSGALVNSDNSSSKFFLMHLILCLGRLITDGATNYIKEHSFQLLVTYATAQTPELQYTAIRALEGLVQYKESLEISSTAAVLINITERTLMSQSDNSMIRNYAARLRRNFEAEKQSKEAVLLTETGESANKRSDEFQGYPSVVAALIAHLSEGGSNFDGAEETLVSMASRVSSHHSERLLLALRESVYAGKSAIKFFEKENKETGLAPVHEAAKSGVKANLQWMLSCEGGEKLVTLKSSKGGLQPIHVAGSTEVLELLLEHRANLGDKTQDGRTIFHTLEAVSVLRQVLDWHKTNSWRSKPWPCPDVTPTTPDRENLPPLFHPRSAEVVDTLVSLQANLHEQAGYSQDTALMRAAQRDEAEVCRALLELRIDPLVVNNAKRTALFGAGEHSLPCLLQTALKEEVNSKDQYQDTPLHQATSVAVSHTLLTCRADVNAKNAWGGAPIAGYSITLPQIELLLKWRANPNAVSSAGDPLFNAAALAPNVSNMEAFLASDTSGELLTQRGEDNSDACQNAIWSGSGTAALHLLVEARANLSAMNSRTGLALVHSGCNPLQLQLLVSSRADPEQKTLFSRASLLHVLIGDLYDSFSLEGSAAEMLLELRSDPCAIDAYGRSVFHSAIHGQGKLECVRALLDSRADPLATEKFHPLVVQWAKQPHREDSKEMLDLVLEKRASINAIEGHTRRTPLSYAAQTYNPPYDDQPSPLDQLLDLSADPSTIDYAGRVSLHYAVENRSAPLQVVRKVMRRWPDGCKVRDIRGETPADTAARLGLDDVEAALGGAGKQGLDQRKLIEADASDAFALARLGRDAEARAALKGKDLMQLRDPLCGDTLLHAALQGGNPSLVKWLLQEAPALSTEPGGVLEYLRQSPLKLLGTLPAQPRDEDALEMARALLHARADPHESDWGRPLALQVHASPGVLQALLGCRASVQHSKNVECLWDGVKDNRVVEVLFKNGISTDCPEGNVRGGNAVTRLATAAGSSALKAVLNQCPEALEKSASEDGESALMAAAASSSTRNVQVLLALRADVAHADKQGCTALHNVGQKGWRQGGIEVPGIVALLLGARAQVDVKAQDGSTALSALGGRVSNAAAGQTVALLLQAKADPQASNQGRPEAFAWAWSEAGLQELLAAKLSLDIRGESGEDLVLAAIRSGRREAASALQLLQRKGVDIFKSQEEDKQTVLHALAQSSMPVFEHVLALLSKLPTEAATELLRSQDDDGNTMLHKLREERKLLKLLRLLKGIWSQQETAHFINMRNRADKARIDSEASFSFAKLLLQSKADATRAIGFLDYEEQLTNLPLVDLLLEHRADINAMPHDASEPALHRIIEKSDVYLARLFLKRGANVHALDASGASAIAHANTTGTIQFLLSEGLDASQQSPLTGETLMHELAKKGDTRVLRFLLTKLRVPVKTNSAGQSLLHVASLAGKVDTVQALVELGFDTKAGDRENQSSLHLACKKGHFATVKYLLDAKASANLADDLGETPLHEAVRFGSLDVYELLIEKKANVLASSRQGHNALHLAASANKSKLIKILLKVAGLDVNAQTKDLKRTALHFAVLKGHTVAVEALLADPRVQIDIEDLKQDSPITIGARTEALLILKALWERHDGTHNGLLMKPLLAAIAGGCRQACELLVEEAKVKLSLCVDASGNNALHQVARNGDDVLSVWLMEKWDTGSAGVFKALYTKNGDGMLPRHVAEQWDHERVQRSFTAFLLKNEIEEPVVQTEPRIEGDAVSGGHCSRFICGMTTVDVLDRLIPRQRILLVEERLQV